MLEKELFSDKDIELLIPLVQSFMGKPIEILGPDFQRSSQMLISKALHQIVIDKVVHELASSFTIMEELRQELLSQEITPLVLKDTLNEIVLLIIKNTNHE
jgi:hypothetical protein